MPRKFADSEKRRFLAELDRSGDSPGAVARRVGISAASAYRWVKSRDRECAPAFARLLPSGAELRCGSSGVGVQVGAVTVIVEPHFDAALLRAVVAALSERTR
jgi:transposase-like protein